MSALDVKARVCSICWLVLLYKPNLYPVFSVTLWPIVDAIGCYCPCHGGVGWGGGLSLVLWHFSHTPSSKVSPFKTSWHFSWVHALLSVSGREDGKREAALDISESALISSSVCVLPCLHFLFSFFFFCLRGTWRENAVCQSAVMARCQHFTYF